MEAATQAWRSQNQSINKRQQITNNSNRSSTYIITSEIMFEVILLGHIEILILLGNSLVILAYFKGPRRIRTITNHFVVNLAISDLMVGCLSVPFWIAYRLGKTEENAYKYFAPLDIISSTTSVLSLVSISLERMYAVTRPAKHFNLSRKPVHKCIALTWVIGIIVAITNAALFESYTLATTLIIFILVFIIPLVIIMVSYLMIIRAAHHLTRADNQGKTINREIRIAKTISVIIGLFVLFWAPFFAINITFVFCSNCFTDWSIPVSLTKIFHYSNSMMNVFVYAVRSPEYRQTFKALLIKCDTLEVRDRLRTMSFQPLSRKSAESRSKLNNNEELSSTEYRQTYVAKCNDNNTKLLDTSDTNLDM